MVWFGTLKIALSVEFDLLYASYCLLGGGDGSRSEAHSERGQGGPCGVRQHLRKFTVGRR